jgi:hypothetical protein
MRLSNFSLVGLIGTLVFLAGLHLLWKNRHAAVAWLREFVCILRGEFAMKTGVLQDSPGSRGAPRSGALVLVGAVALILLGQILFFLDLTR